MVFFAQALLLRRENILDFQDANFFRILPSPACGRRVGDEGLQASTLSF